jgi:hypothetical protein
MSEDFNLESERNNIDFFDVEMNQNMFRGNQIQSTFERGRAL